MRDGDMLGGWLTRIDEVVQQGKEDENKAAGEHSRSSDANNPVDVASVTPGKPKETGRDKNRAEDTGRQSSFGGRMTTMSLCNASITLLVKDCVADSEQHADCNTDKGKTTLSRSPATTLLEHNRESGEAEVESTIDDGHVNRGEQNDGLLEEKDPGSQESNLVLRCNGQVRAAGVDL